MRGRRQAAGQDAELACLQLEHDGVPDAFDFARSRPDLVGQFADGRFELGQRQVLGERVFRRNRLHRTIRRDRILVDAKAELVQAPTVAAEATSPVRARRARAGRRRCGCRARRACASMTLPTPWMRPTGSGVRNASTASGLITNRPSGLFQSEAILARNLFGATPAEAVKRGFLADLCADRPGHGGRRRQAVHDSR